MSGERRSGTPYTIGGVRPDGSAAPVGPWWAGRGVPAARSAPPALGSGDADWHDDAPTDWHGGNGNGNGNGSANGNGRDPDHPIGGFVDPEEVDAPRGMGAGMPFAVLAAVVLAILIGTAFFAPSPVIPRILVPVFGVLATIAASRWLVVKHPDEPWLGGLFVLAVMVKEFASFLRWRTLVNSYGDVGDASVFDIYGKRYSGFWHGVTTVGPQLDDIRKSNFLRFFTGVVYYLFGADMIAGFLIFGLIAFVGSYLWYRAACEAVPFLDKRLYFLVIMFVPSILFWPSSIGKEALMQFAIGSAALGTAHLFNGKLLRGVLVGIPGFWLMWVVRPHLLALVVLAAGVAYLFGQGPRAKSAGEISTSLIKPIGLVLIAFLVVFAIGQGAQSLGLPSLTLGSVQAELDATTVSTGQGGSSFDNGGNSLSPLRVPQGMVTVLLRPFPWEVSSPLQELASLEGVALAGFLFLRRRSLAISLRHLRSVPFMFYCWTLTILYGLTFQAFANFGLLDRQRSLVLPALYVLACLDWRRAREYDEDQRELAAIRRAEFARGGI
jgi:hypothetical protein